MTQLISRLWTDEKGQDIAEYALMLAVILVLVVGTVRLIGSNANTVFSNVASSIQWPVGVTQVTCHEGYSRLPPA
jgi:Flp pilus assembly pilin Flp